MKLKWQQAPVKTQWGDEMVVASVAIDKDHTVCLYCEHDQTSKVEAMFTQRTWVGLTDEETVAIELGLRIPTGYRDAYDLSLRDFARAIEAKLRSKNS